jgi:hypothetical protein
MPKSRRRRRKQRPRDTDDRNEDVEAIMLDTLRRSGAPAEYVYAFQKTGLLGLGGDMSAWPPDRKTEWESAVAEYRRLEQAAKGEKPN